MTETRTPIIPKTSDMYMRKLTSFQSSNLDCPHIGPGDNINMERRFGNLLSSKANVNHVRAGLNGSKHSPITLRYLFGRELKHLSPRGGDCGSTWGIGFAGRARVDYYGPGLTNLNCWGN